MPIRLKILLTGLLLSAVTLDPCLLVGVVVALVVVVMCGWIDG